MGKEKGLAGGSFIQELFQVGVYKRSQGRVTRQVTFAVVALVVSVGAWKLMITLENALPAAYSSLQFVIPAVVWSVGVWFAFRLVNLAQFADFLISVEAEMNKVSWPTRVELFRNSVVVVLVIFGLAAVLFTYDMVWRQLFEFLGVIRQSTS